MWYSNSLAQWFDIPTIATPTHDEKGITSDRVSGLARVGKSPAGLRSLGASSDLKGLSLVLVKLNSHSPSVQVEGRCHHYLLKIHSQR